METNIIPPATVQKLPQNHILVDVENMKSIDTALLGLKHLVFHLFFGPENKKLEIELVEAILTHSQDVKMVRSPKHGKNALDFVLAYHLGQIASAEPKAFFHIISKDSGFDSLVAFLLSKKIEARRHANWASLQLALTPKPPTPPKKSLSPSAEKVLENLKKSPSNRPKKIATLIRQAKSYSGKDATDSMAEDLVAEFRSHKLISVDEKGGVTYMIPS